MSRYRQITVIVVIAPGYLVALAGLLTQPRFTTSTLEVATVVLAGAFYTCVRAASCARERP